VSGPDDSTWLLISEHPLTVEPLSAWAIQPDCGAIVAFCGTARDHAPAGTGPDGQPIEAVEGVTELHYEVYEAGARRVLTELAASVRERFPEVRRIAIAHRSGVVNLGEIAVVVAVSAPHRGPAFESAAFAIDELKRTLPVWKKEVWNTGSAWSSVGSSPLVPPATMPADNLHPVKSGSQRLTDTELGGHPGT
jgi:molybdopterin synthase catalytic subunit